VGPIAETVGVIGAGSWGTALAAHLVHAGAEVTLWAREPEVVEGISTVHRNPLFLSSVDLPAGLTATSDLRSMVVGSEVVVSAVPVQHLRTTLRDVPELHDVEIVVTVSKGIEAGTFAMPHEILTDVGVPSERIVVLSGPSFAREVVAHLPTAVVVAGADLGRTLATQRLFSSERFRVYTSDDVVGVELGGALKNVIALATGVSDGLELGDNARAAIITRGVAEISRLGVALGGHPATFAGLSGFGDLVLTCVGGLSRNRQVGLAIGRGRRLADVEAEMHETAEGVATCASAHGLAEREGVEMPISEQMYRILYEDKDPLEALRDLLGRDLRHERDGAASG
jgi:glycerol-3-phosphate dehydrogenase (NAD(P)+)